MANLTPKEREQVAKEVAEQEKQQFAEWVKIQESLGFTVEGDSFANAQVIEIPKGPTYDDTPGA